MSLFPKKKTKKQWSIPLRCPVTVKRPASYIAWPNQHCVQYTMCVSSEASPGGTSEHLKIIRKYKNTSK